MPKPVRSRVKACETCKAVSSTLYRVVQDDTTVWMLICQAVRQEELWCGVTPDPQVMRDAAQRELAQRNA